MVSEEAIRDSIAKDVSSALQVVRDALDGLRTDPSFDEVASAEWAIRHCLTQVLVPSVMAATCATFLGQKPGERQSWEEVVNGIVPRMLKELGDGPIPESADFLEKMSKLVDPDRWELMKLNLGEAEVEHFSRQSFDYALGAIVESA